MFKDRIKAARKVSKLSQEQLGHILGVSKQTISDYERGYSEPDMAKITMLMSALKVDANYLWQDEMRLNSEPEPDISDRAMEIAKAYDKMSNYGKSLIDKIVENEGRYKIMKVIPMVGDALLDGTVETKHAAKQELQELSAEELAKKPSRLMR